MHALADCRALITGRFYFMTQQPVLTSEAKKMYIYINLVSFVILIVIFALFPLR